MGVVIGECPEADCEATVATCDNNVRLDYPAEPFDREPDGACWLIMPVGSLALAAVGGEPTNGRGHRLHEHQAPES